ncbi:MAG: C25 family cysteine peptidase, partial [candidate division WOR-3 bacterium]
VNNLTNGALTPVVYNIACLCGDIYQPTCLAEAWMRKYPGGAVANMAATQASYTYPNHGICSTIVRSMCDTWTITVPGVRDYVLPVLDIGWIQCNVDAYVAKYWPDGQYPDNIYMYLNLGDPALEVWSGGQPQTPSVDYPTVVPLGPKDFRVTVTVQGNPVLGALVCVAKDTEFYSTGYTDADGRVTLQTNALTPGSFSLTVSSGHAVGAEPTPILPFEGTGMTVSGCYVVYLRHEIADPAPGGNGDGIVNPGETVKVVVWVKNRGIRPSNDVIAKLHSEDPAVVVLDSVRSLGTIAAGDSASTGSDGFLVSVSDTCSNGHFVSLGLICRDAADSSWASYFGLSVGTGVLEYAGKRVSDPAPGGNDNGRLDANETAELFLRLRNVGLGHAYDVRGLLRSGDVRFQVHDSTVNWPFIKKDSLAENTGGGFKVSVGNVAPETDISCTLYVASDDGYHATLPLRLVIGELRPVDPIHDNGVPTLYWAVDESDSGYSERPDFNWIECRGKGFRLGLADDQTMAVSLPPAFGPFIYYNQRYTRISVCSNGWIAAGLATSVSGINAELPTNRLPVPVVCANWDDLDPSAGGSIWVFHDSTNHAYVVEWDSVPYRDAACGTDKFEIVIFDTTLASGDGNSEILVQYQTANGYSSNTVGIQDHTRTVGITCLFDGEYHRGTGVIQAGSAIKYTTDAPLYPLSEPGIISKTPAPILKVSSPVARYVSAEFTLASPTAARLVVYDPSGRELDVLFDTRGVLTPPGSYSVRWNGEACGRKVPSGIYFLQLETRDGTIARKVVKLE